MVRRKGGIGDRGRIKSWHTREERAMIRKYGGSPLVKYGTDGIINGYPVEVRSAQKDSRFRIQKDVHRRLVNSKGSYIFVNGGKSKKVLAKTVSKKMGRGRWFKDRDYPHRFLKVKDIF